ncbi:ATP-binding cassette domain-containing protein [Streptomyces sp. NPDC005492]|uniref:ATP-binding cassette domain-containing protein n=1 Tax=Streptomyces sp. NPDC005492 TaxID=3156883 RepID=UPI0033BC3059
MSPGSSSAEPTQHAEPHNLHERRQTPAPPHNEPTQRTQPPNDRGLPRRGLRFLAARWRVLVRLGGWSVLETGQTFLVGYGLARSLDAGFLAGRAMVGLGWLGVAGVGVAVGAVGTGRVYGAVAALVEPLRDRLVERVVARGVAEADRSALSGLTQQVELARDTFAGLVMVSRSFLFTAVGALAGLCSLAPLLLLVVVPPLVAGVALFAATLRPLARRQEVFLRADEALADRLGSVCPGLRDITAAGAEERVASDTGHLVDAELRAARSLARWGVPRVASLAIGGQLPVLLLLATAPWLLRHGVTPGALLGALAYVTQSLLPALQNLVHGLGTSGSRLAVVLRRLAPEPPATPRPSRPATPPDNTPTHPLPTPRNRAHHPSTNGSRLAVVLRRLTPQPPATPRPSRPATPPDNTPTHPLPTPQNRVHDPSTTGSDLAPPLPAPPPDNPPKPSPAAVTQNLLHGPSTSGSPLTPPPDNPPALSLTSLTFAYGPASEPVLRGLDLDLPCGGHLAVVGPSGIGKSTLTALVAGLLRPSGGAVRVYGRSVAEAGALRVLIPQEAYVFSGSLADNLGQLRPDPVPEAELLAAAEAVGLTPLLEALGGPAAPVQPAQLSAGERQLIALTRAYLSYAPLALLDEATCHLDPDAEERAERAFAGRARPGGALVVVAHRISSARRAERVLVMDGRETALGTHDELLRRSPLYRDLVGSWASEPALPLRDADRVDAVAGPGLAGDGRHVVAHGPVGQVQTPGDLRDGGALGGQG